MAIIRPRLNDYYNIPLLQEEIDFAIPFLDEDIPLYIDPFLMWKIPSMQDNGLHTSIINSFNALGNIYLKGDDKKAIEILTHSSECNEIGLGTSRTRTGKVIGAKTANDILSLFKLIPQINKQGVLHFEEIQLLVDGIGKDRISDISANLIKSFLVDYTIQQCANYQIPMIDCTIPIFDNRKIRIIEEVVKLPVNPENNAPIIFVPKRWLRFSTWINYDDYYKNHYIPNIDNELEKLKYRVEILDYNRHNYAQIQSYIELKENRGITDCFNDPLFRQIPVTSAKSKLKSILNLPTGKTDNADKKYEDLMVQLLASLLYPHLDFAQEQSRVESGAQIRDLIFYNNKSVDFLNEIYNDYLSKQLVVELKNVKSVEREHVNQLHRYLADQFGKFGIIFTRNRPSKSILQNMIDLWSSRRCCILILDDEDLKLMCEVYESKNRLPIEVIKKKYIEFIRLCPN